MKKKGLLGIIAIIAVVGLLLSACDSPSATGPRTPVVEAPTGITATFGQTLSQIEGQLPPNWAWDNPGNLVGNAGTQQHYATYRRPGNFNPVTMSITVTVGQGTPPSYTLPTELTATYGDTLANVGLPERWTWYAPTTRVSPVGELGEQTHYAVYTPADANFSSIRRAVTITVFAESPADPENIVIPTDINATFGQVLSQALPALPATWTWVTPNTLVGNVGDNQHLATYRRVGNYNAVQRNITVTVARATPTYTVPGARTATFGQTLADVTLPANWAWQAAGTTPVGNAGTQTHNAIFSVERTANFTDLTSDPYPITVTVSRATPTYTIPTGLIANIGQTLADIQNQLPPNWAWVDAAASVGAAGNNQHDATFSVEQTDNFTALTVTHPVTVEVSDQERGTFTMTWNNFQDGAPALTGPTLRILGGQAESVTVENPELYTSIRWLRDAEEITGSAVTGTKGETLSLNAGFFGNNIGQHTVTVEVVREDNGRRYSGRVTFTVRP